MENKINGTYLDKSVHVALNCNNAGLFTSLLTNFILSNKNPSKEQLGLFKKDVSILKELGKWDYTQEKKTIEEYVKGVQLLKAVEKLPPEQQVLFHEKCITSMYKTMGLDATPEKIKEQARARMYKGRN